jgi:hypothetical protein
VRVPSGVKAINIGRFHRVVQDRSQKRYFAYDVLVEPKQNALLSFTEGSDRYDIKSTSRIVPAGGRFNLYILHDPEWRPTGDEANSPIIVGAADRAERLVAK